jgi:sirohydrochlorin cobaltochelatase
MELAEPSLEAIVSQGKAAGTDHFTVVPLFLAAGRHLRKDVPAMISELESQHGVQIKLAPPIGQNPQLGDAIRDVVLQELEHNDS